MTRLSKTAAVVLSLVITLLFCGCDPGIKPSAADDSVKQNITISEPNSHSLDDYRKDGGVSETEADADETPATAESNGKDAAGNASGASTEPGNQEYSGLYYANTNTKKFHKSECWAVKKIKPQNVYTSEDRNELIAEGYVPCAICDP